MTLKNKVVVDIWLPKGCSQADDEYEMSWAPINFRIYSTLFQEIIEESVGEYLSQSTLEAEVHYEWIMQHIVEHDGNGAVHAEYFELIHSEKDAA